MNVTSTLEPELGQGRLNAIANLLYYNDFYDGDRQEVEEKLWDGMFGYVKLGISLKAFAHHKKYQKECQTFKQYCDKYLGITISYAKKIMQATEVWVELAKAEFEKLPANISQAMPLIKFNTGTDKTGNCQLYDKWQECINYATSTNQKLTSKTIRKVVNNKETPKQITITDSELWNVIEREAAKAGTSKQDFLKGVIDNYLNPPTPEPPNPEKQKTWEEDLETLVSERESTEKTEKESIKEESQSTDIDPEKPETNCCNLSISFDKTLTPLLNGEKTVTRRVWKKSTVDKFTKAFEEGKWAKALDKSYFRGGKQIGWIKLTKAPYGERLRGLSQEHCAEEGYPESTSHQFIPRFFNGNSSQKVWVLEFEFKPFTVARSHKHP
jgi:hypothetical protein